MTAMSSVTDMISSLLGSVASSSSSFADAALTPSLARHFEPPKMLCETDAILVTMLNSGGHEHVAYCVCDPSQDDLPIIFSSDGFCELTGYTFTEIEGRNCRFLQGPDTAQEDVDRIRTAIQEQQTVEVNLLNYRKDGTTFPNEFFLSPLRDDAHKTVYVRFLCVGACLHAACLCMMIRTYHIDFAHP